MKIAVLSRAPRAYSTQRLRSAALDRGHQVKVLNTLRFGIDLAALDAAARTAALPGAARPPDRCRSRRR